MKANVRGKLATTTRVAASLLSFGLIDILRKPKSALNYWQRLARAATRPGELGSASTLRLPERDLREILPDTDSITIDLVNHRFVTGDMPVHELVALCRIIHLRQPKRSFEIGTFQGGTTLQMAANSEAQIFTLDLLPGTSLAKGNSLPHDPKLDVYPEHPGMRFHGTSYAARIHQLFGDSRDFDFSPYHGAMDFVFVDACHHYEFVRRDSENALKMVSAGGFVVWHDYAPSAPGVIQALDELGQIFPLLHISDTSLVIHTSRAKS